MTNISKYFIATALLFGAVTGRAAATSGEDSLRVSEGDSTAIAVPVEKHVEKKSVVNFTNKKIGKVLTIDPVEGNGGTYKFSLEGRVQTRFDLSRAAESGEYSHKLWFRRARLKSSGHIYSKKLGYKVELDLVNNEILDAIIKYKFAPNTTLWVGQTKLDGNRERVISSQNLQFVDRSRLNSNYNIDRDLGVQVHHHMNLGGWIVRESFAVSTGEGKNYTTYTGEHTIKEGLSYTGRVEVLPFGKFSGKKGEYVSSDLEREATPKLAVGATYSVNDNAFRDRGQRGSELSASRDLYAFFVDAMFKYRGFSAMGEYAYRSTDESAVVLNTAESFEAFRTGQGLNLQAGYLFKNNFEVAGRFTQIWPEQDIRRQEVKEYTLGLSKYIIGHKIKAQTDFSYSDFATDEDQLMWRLQFEISI
ncbi:porin [Algivirga pacifica]|uniref:Phosphate-selective porin O and P n=1 Tax=Algivirga pacifica TaxID=1162670 RepID=A0ABP9DLU3_9BACT